MDTRRRTIIAVSLTTLVLLAIAVTLGVRHYSDTAPDTDYQELAQGWDNRVREQMHHLSFGSRILPYDWLLHLEQADSDEPLRDNAHLAGLGFIPAKASPLNPDGLPVGFSRDHARDGQLWAGVNCAACHTGVIRYNGEQAIVEGAPALIDFSGLEAAVEASLTATLADDGKFQRLAAALAAEDADALRQQLQQRRDYLNWRRGINRSDTAYGHGRLDAFGQIFNTVAVELLEEPANARPANAPVSYPFLWRASHLDLVQWNGSAPNKAPGPLIQNVTTALAVYGTANLVDHSGRTGYPSSVNVSNLGTLQKHYYQLQSPRWPASLLGALDSDRVARGETLYRNNCLACHQLSDRNQAKESLRVTLVPLTEVGTDPRMADNFIDARADTGALQGRKQFVLAGDRFGEQARTIDMVVHAAMGATLRHPVEAVVAAVKDYQKVYGTQPANEPRQYKARPLAGVWATAPYLHNGSVPTLFDLLTPPSERPRQFHVGSAHFDPERVGFDSTAGAHTSLFDTSLPGNHNGGHVYGTDLSEADRLALIEYLKSL
ncbi:MAG: di-heme-cytochrome C peroxidase [Pseudomonadales bacterium]|nr:di-heme-cytochrome C peroxidase [Pseudomonadales bacterium]